MTVERCDMSVRLLYARSGRIGGEWTARIGPCVIFGILASSREVLLGKFPRLTHQTTHMYSFYFRAALLVLLVATGQSVAAQTIVTLTDPGGTTTDFAAAPALFGPAVGDETGTVVTTADACAAISADLTGAVALVLDGTGGCSPAIKALNVQAAGAVAVVLCTSGQPVAPLASAPTVNVPVVALDSAACATLAVATMGSTVSFGGPGDGYSCQTAITITDGTYTAVAPDTGYAAVVVPALNVSGDQNAVWYKYTIPQDGFFDINSCNGGADTRLFIAPSLDCNTVADQFLGGNFFGNDDACPVGDGTNFASRVSGFVQGGTELTIVWQDRWSSDAFDFTISTEAAVEQPVSLTVDLSNEDLMGQAVQIGGNFTDTLLTLTDNGDGTYTYSDSILGGTELLYNFYLGGTAEPTGDLAACSVTDPDGSVFRRVFVGLEPIEAPTVCFGRCNPCTIVVDDCDNPAVLIDDDYSGYDLGSNLFGQVSYWEGWDGGTVSGVVDTIDGEPAVLISESIADQDAVFTTGLQAEGHFIVQFDLYVPTGNAAYYNLQHRMPAPGAFANQVFFNTDGTGFVDLFGLTPDIEFTYPQGEFFRVHTIIDIDNAEARMFVEGAFVGGWDWSIGSFNQAASTFTEFYGVNFFPLGGDADEYTYYVDNTTVRQIPPATDGLYCYTAEPVTPGTYTTPELDCFGGLFFNDESADNRNVIAGAWYSYTPDANGRITVESCESGRDSRVWILEGDCRNFSLVGVNDDQCGDNTFASLREAYVYAGRTYYLLWDALWDTNPTEWSLEFTAEDGGPGDFCQTAIAIDPGVFSIDDLADIDGNAAVTGKRIPRATVYSGGSTPTAYSQTIWYQYTPAADGEVSITACDLTTEDTRVFVYTGSCENFDSLTVVASDDDGCGGSGGPSLLTFDGSAGTTYFIEWDNAFLDNGFLWELQGQQAAMVDVTFIVDLSEEDTPADTAFVIGAFTGWIDPIALEDQGNDLFIGTVAVPANDTFAYKFQNGRGNFENGDFLEECGVSGGFGFDRLLITGDTDMTMDTVCFGYCVSCNLVNTDDPVFRDAFRVEPNPMRDVAVLRYALPTPRALRITLTDGLGQTLRTYQIDGASSGTQRLETSDLAPGLYQLVITDGTYVHGEKLLKQ